MKNSKRYKRTAIMGLVFTLVALVAINVIFSFFYFRIDLTQDKRNSLSETTIDMLRSLDDKVYIKVYLKGENNPVDYQVFAQKTADILQEFRRYSKNIYFEFIDPLKDKSREEANAILGEFYKKGLQPITINKEDDNGFSTHYVVPGAMIMYKTKEAPATLVVSDPESSDWLNYSVEELEYNLVSIMRQLLNPQKRTVAFVDGHGELSPWSTSWMMFQLQKFYAVERVNLDGKINSLRNVVVEDSINQTIKVLGNKYDVLVIAQPTERFSEQDKYLIDQHIMHGGKVLWLVDATTASLDSLQTTPTFLAQERNLNLNTLFFKYGVRFHSALIQDLNCQAIPIPSGYIGNEPQYKMWAFPYLANFVNFTDHPIVRKMKNIKSDFSGVIDFVNSAGDLRKTVLITSSERTKMVPTPSLVTLDVIRTKPNMEEYAFKYLPVAVLVEGKFTSAYSGRLPVEFDTVKQFDFVTESPETRQIFIADGDIIRNYFDSKTNQPYPTGYDIYTRKVYDNSDFIVNCVNYLCADDDLLQIRSKNFKLGLLNAQKSKEKKTYYAVVNVAVPLICIFLLGTVMIVIRKRKFGKNR